MSKIKERYESMRHISKIHRFFDISFEELRRQAADVPEMSLEEINQEIADVRRARGKSV